MKTFETNSSYCRVTWQGLPRKLHAVLKSNLFRSIEFGTALSGTTFETVKKPAEFEKFIDSLVVNFNLKIVK